MKKGADCVAPKGTTKVHVLKLQEGIFLLNLKKIFVNL